MAAPRYAALTAVLPALFYFHSLRIGRCSGVMNRSSIGFSLAAGSGGGQGARTIPLRLLSEGVRHRGTIGNHSHYGR